MLKRTLILCLMVLIHFACQKDSDENDWKNCTGCSTGNWLGAWSGPAEHFDAHTSETTSGLTAQLEINETGTDYLTLSFQIPGVFSTTLSGEVHPGDNISLASTSASVLGTLYVNGAQYKIEGTAKKFHYKVDSLIIDQVVTFQAFRNDDQ
ncbi:MAG: hypothetical protein Kow00127_14900 [Bacteroidales bacterium]